MSPRDLTGARLIRQITWCSVICILVTFLTVALTAAWMARSHDRQAAQTTRTMVAGVLESARARLAKVTDDYAWWEDGYRAIERSDRAWLDHNLGTAVTSAGTADAAVILSPDGAVEHAWTTKGSNTSALDILTTDVLSQIGQRMEGALIGPTMSRTVFARSGSGLLIVSAARMAAPSEVAGLDVQRLAMLVVAQHLGETQLKNLGKAFPLQALHVISEPDGQESILPLDDVHGKPVGYLTWASPAPGRQMLQDAFRPLMLALAVFCLSMLGISYRTRMLALALSRSETKALAAARVDPLTALMNRTGFNELVASDAFVTAAKAGTFALIYLDVNGFKRVNDTVGHCGGDELVVALAARFRNALPPEAHLARIGGDEFTVILMGAASTKVRDVALSLIAATQRPFPINRMEFEMTCAVGYAVAGQDADDPDTLIRRADTAMYVAKSSGQREPLRFRPSMETGAHEKKLFEGRLRRGIHDGELDVVYQPIARTSDCAVVGLEALVRWNSPTLGTVSPHKMIAVAEQSGLIREIGDFVLDRACEDMHRWPDLRVSVNVSPVQLRDPDFVTNFQAILARHGIAPARIELELTEGVLIADPASAAKKLAQLRKLGTTIALDDFGTGFSSIGYLRSFPFDRVKIDRSFTQELGKNKRGADLLQSLVALAATMDLPTVAEGVETAEHVRMLDLGECQFIQGFFLHRPASATIIEEWVREKRAPPKPRGQGSTVVKLKTR